MRTYVITCTIAKLAQKNWAQRTSSHIRGRETACLSSRLRLRLASHHLDFALIASPPPLRQSPRRLAVSPRLRLCLRLHSAGRKQRADRIDRPMVERMTMPAACALALLCSNAMAAHRGMCSRVAVIQQCSVSGHGSTVCRASAEPRSLCSCPNSYKSYVDS